MVDSKRHHYVIVDGRVLEAEAGNWSFSTGVDSDRHVVLVTSHRHRGSMPGRSCGRSKVHDEGLRAQIAAGRLGRHWSDGMHEDDG
jgi:hypothetical protein